MATRIDQPLPPSFDPAFYRVQNPDLDLPEDHLAAAHYNERGRAEGRLATPLAVREGLVSLVDTERPALEVGPFCAPMIAGPQVEYLDRLDATALKARAEALGLDAASCPDKIHHIGSLEAVPSGRYDAVFASHSIEHHPDLIRHLEEIARVLRPNGRYLLVIPDKRFCFDHFLPESTIADVLDAFEEERAEHKLASVVEHVALVTHNDPVRHWLGDHGGIDEIERARRAAEALAWFRRSDGAELDVHAWQFTPFSFVAILETLARLNLSAFRVEAVYDTPRDRAEFCAVLRRVRPARRSARRRHGRDIIILQTADPMRYASLLAITAPNISEYCRRHGITYESFVGIKRGTRSWHACFNRIIMLQELADRDFTGWGCYLDADAYIRDLDFDLLDYLKGNQNKAAIFATSGMSAEHWDVNAGVAFINFGHPVGRLLVQAWAAQFEALSDEALRDLRVWGAVNDQAFLHAVLRDNPEIADAVLVESLDLLNSNHARFVRQRLRAQFDRFEDRVSTIRDEVAAVARAWQVNGKSAAAQVDGRAAARTLHPIEGSPWLVEAYPGQCTHAAAKRSIQFWRDGTRKIDEGYQHEFAAALEQGNSTIVAASVASLGRSSVARGLLGGDRQHKRCADDAVFAQERALRTHDSLLSLAEMVGAVNIESPDVGSWGLTRKIAAPGLFAGVEYALGCDLAPPNSIGSYLGIDVGRGIVLHLRMVEAIHTAWRIGQLLDLMELPDVTELGGGIGLTAWYAGRLGGRRYHLVGRAIDSAIQAAVLADAFPAFQSAEAIQQPVSLMVAEDLANLPEQTALRYLEDATAQGASAFLSIAQDGDAGPAGPRSSVADLLFQIGGWRRLARTRHAIRPGYVEEIYVRRD